MKLLIATRSAGKTREVRDILHGLPFEVVFPSDLHLERFPAEAELESGQSYAANAVSKARYFSEQSGLATCADDSGLEVDALGGAPAVHSARFAELHGRGSGRMGVSTQDAANNALLLEKLEGVPVARRTARYRCVLAYLQTPISKPELVEAACEGHILLEPRGPGGFGYDPLFFSTDLQMSFGEAAAAAKHRVSHRGRAFRALVEVLIRRA
jgi:XTP/dITP diphosphohydrolase